MYSFATFVCTITSTLKFNAFIILPVVLFVHWHNDHYCNKTSLIEHTVYTTWPRDCFSCACWRRLTMPCTRPCRPRSWPTPSRPRASTRSTSTSCTSVCCGHTCDVMKYESVLEFITKKNKAKTRHIFVVKCLVVYLYRINVLSRKVYTINQVLERHAYWFGYVFDFEIQISGLND